MAEKLLLELKNRAYVWRKDGFYCMLPVIKGETYETVFSDNVSFLTRIIKDRGLEDNCVYRPPEGLIETDAELGEAPPMGKDDIRHFERSLRQTKPKH